MGWPEAFAIVGIGVLLLSLPLAIMVRDYKMHRTVLDFKDRHPDIDVQWKSG